MENLMKIPYFIKQIIKEAKQKYVKAKMEFSLCCYQVGTFFVCLVNKVAVMSVVIQTFRSL